MSTSEGVSEISLSSKHICSVKVSEDLHTLLTTVDKTIGNVTRIENVFNALRNYIIEKKLFDPQHPFRIVAQGDQLASVFGVNEFNIWDVKNLLSKFITFSKSSEINSYASTCCNSPQKRKISEENVSEERTSFSKRSFSEKFVSTSENDLCYPLILYIPPTPNRSDSLSDDVESVQGYETATIKDTSDEETLGIEVQTFDVEYEVESDSDSFSDSNNSESTDNEEDVLLGSAIIASLFVCKSDTDLDYLADDSSVSSYAGDSSSDIEISELDNWECTKCGCRNIPTFRSCQKCWHTRNNWLPDRKHTPPKKRKRRGKHTSKERENIIEKETPCFENITKFCEPSTSCNNGINSSETESICTSRGEEISESTCSIQNVTGKKCIICYSNFINSSIIHGNLAHTISCFSCSKKLKKSKKPCPICRRRIERVVLNVFS